MSQGQIDGVLNARAEDRRSIIEEAAGVLKYRKRKERAERRLDATEGNLAPGPGPAAGGPPPAPARWSARPRRPAATARWSGSSTALRIHVAGRDIAALQRSRRDAGAGAAPARGPGGRGPAGAGPAWTPPSWPPKRASAPGGDGDVGDALVRVEQLRERARGLSAVLLERRRSLERDRRAAHGRERRREPGGRRGPAAVRADRGGRRPASPGAGAAGPGGRRVRPRPATSRQPAATPTDEDAADGTRAARAAAEVRGELHARRAARLQGSDGLVRVRARASPPSRRRSGCWRRRITELDAAGRPGRRGGGPAGGRGRGRGCGARAPRGGGRGRGGGPPGGRGPRHRVDGPGRGAGPGARRGSGAARAPSTSGTSTACSGSLLDLVEIERGWEAAVEAALGEALAAVVVAGRGRGAAVRSATCTRPASTVGCSHRRRRRPGARHRRRRGPDQGPVRAVARAGGRRRGWRPSSTICWPARSSSTDVVGGARPGAGPPGRDRRDPGEVTASPPAGFRVGSGGAGATAAALDEARPTSAAAAVDVTTAGHRAGRRPRRAGRAGRRSRVAAGPASTSLVADARRGRAGHGRRPPPLRRPAGRRSDQARPERDASWSLPAPGGRGHRRAGAVPSRPWRRTRPRRWRRLGCRHEQRRRREERAQALATAAGTWPCGPPGWTSAPPCWSSGWQDVESRLAAGSRAPGRRRQRASSSSSARPTPSSAWPSWSSVTAARSSCASPSCTSSGAVSWRRRGRPRWRSSSCAVERADAERRLAEVGERQRRCEITEAEVRTRLEAAVEHVAPRARHRAVRGHGDRAARRCPTVSRRRPGCGTWSARSA